MNESYKYYYYLLATRGSKEFVAYYRLPVLLFNLDNNIIIINNKNMGSLNLGNQSL